jgi:DNA polymerase-3 subunit gamma/tau
MAYTVLARRYRSQRFDDIIGQDAIAQTLKNAIATAHVAHAYLFTGTRGVGKTTMARILAKALNCLESETPTTEPCCKCDSCVSVNIGEDIDVIEIDGASNTGVENIRQLRQNAIYRPARARYKIYIIDEVHMLSTGAFNALLKILEEPPEHVKFIFATTEPNKVLPTIQSRCQRFDFSTIAPQTIAEQLTAILKAEKIKARGDLILHLARLANGSMRDALSLLDQLISTGVEPLTLELLEEFLGQPNSEKVADLVEKIGDSDPAAALEAIEKLLQTGQTANQIVASLIDCMRDLMVIKSTNENSDLLILTERERKTMAALTEKFDTPALIYNITALEKLHWTIKNSEAPRALLEASILRLTLSEHFLGLDILLNKLNRAPRAAKKKVITPPDRPTQKPVSQQSGSLSPDKPILTQPPTTESVKNNWQNILIAVKVHDAETAVLLGGVTPGDFRQNTFTLCIPKSDGFTQSMCEKNAEKIESCLSLAIGADIIKLNFEATDDKERKRPARSPGARLSTKEKEKILSDPAIQTLLTGLNATDPQVEKIRED